MGTYLPRFVDADTVSITAAAAITGGGLITTTGVVPGDAATNVAGVPGFDVVSGQSVTTYRTGIHLGVASGAINNGDSICSAGANKVRTWVTGVDAPAARIGRAWSTAADAASVTYSLFGV